MTKDLGYSTGDLLFVLAKQGSFCDRSITVIRTAEGRKAFAFLQICQSFLQTMTSLLLFLSRFPFQQRNIDESNFKIVTADKHNSKLRPSLSCYSSAFET